MVGKSANERYLPLTESTFYILTALMEPQHGYAIMQDVNKMSRGAVQLGPGTLYGAVTKLEESKLIKMVDEVDRRKIYVITPAGQDVLDSQCDRFTIMLRNVRAKRKHSSQVSNEG